MNSSGGNRRNSDADRDGGSGMHTSTGFGGTTRR